MSFLSYRKLDSVAVVDSAGHSVAFTPTVCNLFCNDSNKDLGSATVLLQV